MEIGDSLELEEITMVRGAHDHILERGDERQTRRDRNIRDIRGQHNRGDRRRRHRDGERDREGDYRSNKGPRHHPCRR